MSSNKKYFLNELNFSGKNAGYKARVDVYHILSKRKDISTINIPLWGDGVFRASKLLVFLKIILFKIKSKDVIIIQYPFPKPFIDILIYIAKIRKIKLCLLLHDVDILRGQTHNKDFRNLKSAALLITHNLRMSSELGRLGILSDKIELGIFDYIVDGHLPIKDSVVKIENKEPAIIYCGNLSKDKSKFIYFWPETDVKRYVFGVNASDDINTFNIYKGSFDADYPPNINSAGRVFGLVWDGDSINECSGQFGEYLKFNNPHKTSLYLAMGIPVIVWKHSAISDFVEKHNLGIVVESLTYLDMILESITEEEYCSISNSVDKLKGKITTGGFLNEVTSKVVGRFN